MLSLELLHMKELADQSWRHSGPKEPVCQSGQLFYIHLFKSPGAVVEIPVAKRARVSSVTALSDGSKLSTRKVGEKLFVTVPGELPADSDYVIKVTLR